MYIMCLWCRILLVSAVYGNNSVLKQPVFHNLLVGGLVAIFYFPIYWE